MKLGPTYEYYYYCYAYYDYYDGYPHERRREQLAEPESPDRNAIERPADRLENSTLLSMLVGVPGLLYLVHYFFFAGGGLNLNSVNFLFLSLAIVLHRTPRSLLASLNEAIKGGAGIVIQFPFYAGIMGIMMQSGLAQSLSELFVAIANADTLPFWSFISAGIVNLFVPSGGGQWAVQAPVMLPAAEALGVDVARVSMAVAWGASSRPRAATPRGGRGPQHGHNPRTSASGMKRHRPPVGSLAERGDERRRDHGRHELGRG